MPYEVSFIKRLTVPDREQYINECCVAGDVVVNRLLPAVRARYVDIQSNQEDWGWFIWFRRDRIRLAIDVFTEDSDEGLFRIHLTSRVKRFLLLDAIVDSVELEELRTLVEAEISAWGASGIKVVHLDSNYNE